MLREVPKQTRWWRPVRRVCAEATALPLADATVDVVFSSLCLQWVPDLPAALAEFRRVLRPDGLLLFATFGPDTLLELREAYLEAGERAPPLSTFAPIQPVGDALVAAGFRDPVLDRDRFELTYPDVGTLLRELRAIGANDARAQRPRGLGGKARHAAMTAAYETRRRDGKLPSAWEVISAMAWAPAPGTARRENGVDIAAIPVDRIPIRRR
jgi:malonyl-CoA O-methyltransferase